MKIKKSVLLKSLLRSYPKDHKDDSNSAAWKRLVIIPPTSVKKDPKRLEILQ